MLSKCFKFEVDDVCLFWSGLRGFAGMGVGGPPGMRPMAPRGGAMQPRPLMDFGEQPDGAAFFAEQMQV